MKERVAERDEEQQDEGNASPHVRRMEQASPDGEEEKKDASRDAKIRPSHAFFGFLFLFVLYCVSPCRPKKHTLDIALDLAFGQEMIKMRSSSCYANVLRFVCSASFLLRRLVSQARYCTSVGGYPLLPQPLLLQTEGERDRGDGSWLREQQSAVASFPLLPCYRRCSMLSYRTCATCNNFCLPAKKMMRRR